MGKPGRKPIPTKLKLLKGNPGKQKLNKREPQPKLGIPAKPKWLLPAAAKEWDLVVPTLEQLGLLAVVDGPCLAGYCQSYARYIEAQQFLDKYGSSYDVLDKLGALSHVGQYPQVTIAKNEAHAMRMFASEFGFTPASRSRIEIPDKVEPADPFEAFLGKKVK